MRSLRRPGQAIADTSVFVARETGRELGELPEEIAVSVITAAELELGVLRASEGNARAVRLAALSRVQATYPLLPVDPEVASSTRWQWSGFERWSQYVSAPSRPRRSGRRGRR